MPHILPSFPLLHFLLIELSSKRRLLVLDLTGSRSDSSSKWAGNQTSSGCVSGSPSLYLFSYIWFDKSGTILRRAGLSMRMCERITVSRLWHLSLASRWGNYQSGHRLHLYDEIIHFVFVLDDQIFQSWLNNPGFKMMYQKMCLKIPYQSSSLVIVPNSENIYLTRCNGITASKVDPFYQSLSCNQTPEAHFYSPENKPSDFSVSDSLLTF